MQIPILKIFVSDTVLVGDRSFELRPSPIEKVGFIDRDFVVRNVYLSQKHLLGRAPNSIVSSQKGASLI